MILWPGPGDDGSLETSLPAADAHLAACHPSLAALVASRGPCPLARRPPERGSHLEALAAAICSQQLAGPAAAAIWARVRALGPGGFDAPAVAVLDPADLRTAGLSRAKAASLVDLARQVVEGRLDLDAVATRDDDEVIATLTRVRGIGRWTAQMFLIFRLQRLDVWPTGDLGVRRGYAVIHGLAGAPAPQELEGLGDAFRPWRSVAAWYCWRAVDAPAPARR